MTEKISGFAGDNNILYIQQHGFQLYWHVDQHIQTVGIFIDLSKLFDLVNHALLLRKLKLYGLRGNVNS